MRRAFTIVSVAAAFLSVAAPSAVRADAPGDLATAANRFAHLHSWHADEIAGGRTSQVDFVAPDRFRITGSRGVNYLVGSTMYVSMGGRYVKLNLPQAASAIQRLRSPAYAAKFTKSHAFKDLGTSSVDGVATHAYAFDDTEYGITTHDVIDVAQSDGLPHRMTIKSNQGTATIKYSRYNVPVTINPPA